ncbi:hypothetical protein ACFUPZ_05375 [Microbacterium oxydans]|uniref:hypothetical protein n=1 Tax=Microbacterium oxydans TaxID=82380 RepID=UPI0036364A1A
MGEEMDAAIVGAAIAALVAVVLFVIERSVARHAAFVERRRLAFSEVIESFGTFVSATIESKGVPPAENASRLLGSRSRMSLALGKKDRALNWWLTGMEKRVGAAARLFATDPNQGIDRIDALYEDVSNTLIDIHLGNLNRHDIVVPAAFFWAEHQSGFVRPDLADLEGAAERPRRDPRAHGFRARLVRVWLWFTRPVRRRRVESWLPSWADASTK